MGCDLSMITWYLHACFILHEIILLPTHMKLSCRIGFSEISDLFFDKHFNLLNKAYCWGYDSIWAVLKINNFFNISDRVRNFKLSLYVLFFSSSTSFILTSKSKQDILSFCLNLNNTPSKYRSIPVWYHHDVID